jgi:hypothetical protein
VISGFGYTVKPGIPKTLTGIVNNYSTGSGTVTVTVNIYLTGSSSSYV